MKLIKKIGFLIVFISLTMPLTNVFALEGGLLDGRPMITNYDDSYITEITDNDPNTTYTNRMAYETIYYNFSSPATIHELHLYDGLSNYDVRFFNSDMQVIYLDTVSGRDGLVKFDTPYTDVKRVAVYFKGTSVGSYAISEFDVFGESNEPEPEPEPEPDTDGDGVPDSEDDFPNNPDHSKDTDGDGVPDSEDDYPDDPTNGDQDGDGVPDSEDDFPNDPDHSEDTDGDGIPDSEDEYPDDPTNTPQPVGEVENLEIDAQHDRVDLSWTLPESNRLHHVNIYRDEIVKTSMIDKVFGVTRVYAAETKIFETNGTYFNDLTVEPGTDYEYTLTTTGTDGVESAGVTVTTEIPEPPLIDLNEVSLPFGASELISSGNGLLALVGGFVLLALAFILVPKFIQLMKGSTGSKNGKAAAETKEQQRAARETRIPRQARQAPPRERIPRQSARQPRQPRAGRGTV